jgi:hypothetical protein
VARDLTAAGAEVAGFLVSCAESVPDAAQAIEQAAGIRPRGYFRLEEMLASERLDAVAILSPSATHEAYLTAAAEHGLHVLCEKPLIWGGSGLLARARARVAQLSSRGLLLAENCQWPYTLEAFERLHPGLRRPPRSFRMRLSPTGRGVDRIADSLHHPLSLLPVLLPGPAQLRDLTFPRISERREDLGLRFRYCVAGVELDAEVALRPVDGVPRPASLEIDGLLADRRIQAPGYAQIFTDGSRSVPVHDPLTARLRAFVRELDGVLAGSPIPDPAAILERMQMLELVVESYQRAPQHAAHQ